MSGPKEGKGCFFWALVLGGLGLVLLIFISSLVSDTTERNKEEACQQAADQTAPGLVPSVLGRTVEESRQLLNCVGYKKVGAVSDMQGDTRPVDDSWIVVAQLPLPDSTDIPPETEIALAARPKSDTYSVEQVSGECKNMGPQFVPFDDNPAQGKTAILMDYVVTLRNTSALPARLKVRFYFEDYDQPASGVGPERYTRWGGQSSDGDLFSETVLQPGEEVTLADSALAREPGPCHIEMQAVAP